MSSNWLRPIVVYSGYGVYLMNDYDTDAVDDDAEDDDVNMMDDVHVGCSFATKNHLWFICWHQPCDLEVQ